MKPKVNCDSPEGGPDDQLPPSSLSGSGELDGYAESNFAPPCRRIPIKLRQCGAIQLLRDRSTHHCVGAEWRQKRGDNGSRRARFGNIARQTDAPIFTG